MRLLSVMLIMTSILFDALILLYNEEYNRAAILQSCDTYDGSNHFYIQSCKDHQEKKLPLFSIFISSLSTTFYKLPIQFILLYQSTEVMFYFYKKCQFTIGYYYDRYRYFH